MQQRRKNTSGSHGPALDLDFKERLGALRNLPEFFSLIWSCNNWLAALNILLRVIRASLPLAMLYVGKLIIDEIVRISVIASGPAVENPDMSIVTIYVLIELGLAVFSDLLGRGIALLDSLLGDLVSHEISLRLMHQSARLDLECFEDSDFYDKLERARRQASSRILLMSQVLAQLQDSITVFFLAAALITFNAWLLLLLAITLIPAFLGETHFNSQSYSLMYGWTQERRELDYLRFAGASDETAKEVKIFGLSDFFGSRYKKLAGEYYRANRDLSARRAAWGGLLSMVGSLGYYTAYAVIIYRTVYGELSLGDLTFLSGSFLRLRSLMEAILIRFSSIADSALYLRDLFDFLEMEPRIISIDNSLPFPVTIRKGFTFENVGFRYPQMKQWVLRDVSFTLHPGEKLALVGENGAGKTTLVKLLTRLYDPVEGRIMLDGHDLRKYNLDGLRDAVGVIFQDYVKYHLTATENIAVGLIDERNNETRIKEAARQSLADKVIENLPNGYQQMIGRWFKQGTNLSGGEWQKIAIARAYMRDAQLLILDEPTASLDARAENEVFRRFVELTFDKCAVLISHRFSTVRMADRIVVLHEGKLLEHGTHDELLAVGGRYSELFQMQAAGYC
ncbi:MAG: ABC transporter ATP-binding protein/permease [SAR324 cluster bacterium]|nr:ABC transporter ATP-binding protein/permease [SAR324 cluster bacterium]|tara:strand:+ start:889 stop:2754 length:1866 start_codon:yes stop_codon:yes gene_type:complete